MMNVFGSGTALFDRARQRRSFEIVADRIRRWPLLAIVLLASTVGNAMTPSTTTASAATFNYDVPVVARVEVDAIGTTDTRSAQISASQDGSASTPPEVQVTSTTPVAARNATNSRALVDPGKYDYLFGNVSSNSHNLARSLQNQRQLNGIGVFDNATGRNLLSSHFDEVVSTNSNVLRTWTDEFGTFQARESLLAGPNGFLKLESTWQVTSDGLRLTTVIPFGGG
jgi:hypothetical protein